MNYKILFLGKWLLLDLPFIGETCASSAVCYVDLVNHVVHRDTTIFVSLAKE